MIKNIIAVILDWAGTSVDYGCCGPTAAFVEVFKKWNLDISMQQVRQFMGLAKKDHTRHLLQLPQVSGQWKVQYGSCPDEDAVDRVYKDLEPLMVRIIPDYAVPVPGAIEFIRKLKKYDIKIGSTTGYTKAIMEKCAPKAEELGFKPDCLITSSDVLVGRPYPYMCYLNAIHLEVFPFYKMVKIGDTVNDIYEGLNAGMWTIGLIKSGNEVGLSQDAISKADPKRINMLMEKAEKKLLHAGAHYVASGIWDCFRVVEEIGFRIGRGERPALNHKVADFICV